MDLIEKLAPPLPRLGCYSMCAPPWTPSKSIPNYNLLYYKINTKASHNTAAQNPYYYTSLLCSSSTSWETPELPDENRDSDCCTRSAVFGIACIAIDADIFFGCSLGITTLRLMLSSSSILFCIILAARVGQKS